MNDDWPIRVALQQTLVGLIPQIPFWPMRREDDAPTSLNHLHWMAAHALAHYHEWPTDKTSRWIGFIQGVLANRGFLNVEVERDRTRPIFHQAYRTMGLMAPERADSSLRDPEGAHAPSVPVRSKDDIRIILNGANVYTAMRRLMYGEVVNMGLPGWVFGDPIPTVTYKAPMGKTYILTPGCYVDLHPGMVINCTITERL